MIKLIKYELIKLFSQKNIKYIFVLLLLISTLFVYLESINYNQSSKNFSVYCSIKNDMDGMKIVDKSNYLNTKVDFLNKVSEYEKSLNAQIFQQGETVFYDSQFIIKYEQFVKTDEYENKEVYYDLYTDLLNYYTKLLNYDNYLEQVKVNGENYQKGIFWLQATDEKKFDVLNAVETYSSLKGIELKETNTLSIDIYNHMISPYLIMLIAGVLVAFVVFQEDETTQMGQLQLICKQGKYKTATAKLIVVVVFSAIISIIVNIVSLLFLQAIYGFVDGGLDIQSISTLYESPYPLSIMQYLIYMISLKTIFVIMTIILFCGVHKIFKKGILSISILGIIFVISGIFYLTINETQTIGLLKYLNLYSFLCSNHFFAKYINGLAYYHVNILLVSIIIAIMIMGIFAVIYYACYTNRQKLNLQKISELKVCGYIKSTNLFVQELFKNLWINKAIVFIVLFIVLQGYYLMNTYNSVPTYIKNQELKIAQIISQFDGKLSDKEVKALELQNMSYEEEKIELDIQYQNYLNGEIDQEAYNEFVYHYLSGMEEKLLFNQVYEKFINSNEYLTYDTGFRAITSLNTYSREIRCAIFLILTMVFLSYALVNSDRQNNENCLFVITTKGRGKRLSKRITMIVVLGILLTTLYTFVELFVFKQIYPMDDWFAPLSSIITGDDNIVLQFPFISSMPIWQYYLQFLLIRIFAVITCGIIGLFISKFCKNKIQAFIILVAIFLLPLLLYMSGLQFVLQISLFDMVMGNLFIHTQFILTKIIIFAVMDLIILITLFKKEKEVY